MLAGLAYLPHGAQIIPEIEIPYNEDFRILHNAMETIREKVSSVLPETVLIITPHGIATDSQYGMYLNETLGGTVGYGGFKGHKEYSFQTDLELGNSLYHDLNSKELPLTSIVVGTRGTQGLLNWGELVPLHYIAHDIASKPKILVISIPLRRYEDLKGMVTELQSLGKELAQFINKESRKIFVGFSGDLSHVHDEKGPYGYHVSCKEMDSLMNKYIETGNQTVLINDCVRVNETALTCGLASLIILDGLRSIIPKKGKLLAYKAPTYFGMSVALFE